MNAIFGTTVEEFTNGLDTFATKRGKSDLINPYFYMYYGYFPSPGDEGGNTLSSDDVWKYVTNGIDRRNAPVAFAIGVESRFDSGMQDYLNSGGQAIIDERKVKYENFYK